jgi:hypothetical protein
MFKGYIFSGVIYIFPLVQKRTKKIRLNEQTDLVLGLLYGHGMQFRAIGVIFEYLYFLYLQVYFQVMH